MVGICKRLKKAISGFLVFLMVFSLVGIGSYKLDIESARAEGGVSMVYLSDNNIPPMLVSTSSAPVAAARFEMYDASGGTIQNLNVKVQKNTTSNGFDPGIALRPLASNSASSGMSLWRDNGDGVFNPMNDTLATNMASIWTAVDSNTWSASFTGINWTVSPSYSSKTILFLAFNAQSFSPDASDPFAFQIRIDPFSLTFSGGSIGSWPSSSQYRGPVIIGLPGSGGYGSPLLISEIQTANSEFVELYNRNSTSSVPLSGWSLKYCLPTQSTLIWSNLVAFGSSTEIRAGGFYLSGNGSLGTSTDAAFASSSLVDNGGFVGLFNSVGTLMDLVAYGNLTNNSLAEGGQPAALYSTIASSSIERKAYSDSGYSTMVAGGVHHNLGNAQDANNNQADFIIRPSAEPQNSHATLEFSSGLSTVNHLLINEIFHNTALPSNRWFEIYNPTATAVNIQNYTLKHKAWSYLIAASSSIPAFGYMTIHWNLTGTNNASNYYTGLIGNDLDQSGGDISIRYGSAIVDYVQYGGPTFHSEAEAASQGQWVINDFVPNCLYGQSLGRKSSAGQDSNRSGDWQSFLSPSAGAPNFGADTDAPASISNVTLDDNDSTGYGLNGLDLAIAWTPDVTADPSFSRYDIFLLPQNVSFDPGIHRPIDSVYQQYQASSTTFAYTGSSYLSQDSAGNALINGYYKAYVTAIDKSNNKSVAAISAAALLSTETYLASNDQVLPKIFHTGVWRATASSSLHLVAQASDDRLMATSHALKVFYKVGADANLNLSLGATSSDCFVLEDGWYDCYIPYGGWTTSDTVAYYLAAKDDAGNLSYLSASPGADLSTAQNTPFYIDIATSTPDSDSNFDLAGHVYRNDGNPIASSTLFLEGLSLAPWKTATTGAFSLPDNSIGVGAYSLRAVKAGYQSISKSIYQGTQDATLYLSEGQSSFSSDASSGANPAIIRTVPASGLTGATRDIFCNSDCSAPATTDSPLSVTFDRPMNAITINDHDAADSGSNIYLTSTGNDRISGRVFYDSSNNTARFYSTDHGSLALGATYTLVVTQGVKDTSGKPVIGSNADGSFGVSFTTLSSITTDSSSYGLSGSAMPPAVASLTPVPGAFHVARNALITIKFSEPMDVSTINADSVRLYPVVDANDWTLGTAVSAAVTLDPESRTIATLDPIASLNASYGWWVIQVKGNAKSLSGIYMANPSLVGGCADYDACTELGAITAFESSFQIDPSLTDTQPPIVTGTYPKNNDGISSTSDPVNVGLGALLVGFSEAMDRDTVTANNIRLLSGSNAVNGKISYDPASFSAKFMPASALLPYTQYSFQIAGLSDLSGNRLAATNTVFFKTGPADSSAPRLLYASGNDYSLALTFSEPMNAAQPIEADWPSSLLNPANFSVNGFVPLACATPGSWSCGAALSSPYDTPDGTGLASLGLRFSYDEDSMTLFIQGFDFGSATDFQIFADNLRDKSNNLIIDSGNRSASPSHGNAARAPLYSSISGQGSLGPNTVSQNLDMAKMGVMKAGAFPMSTLAGQKSAYSVNIPTARQIPIGGKIILSFPAGFGVAQASKSTDSLVNNDINGSNIGSVQIASVTGSQDSRTVIVTTAISATQPADYLHLDIDGIDNSLIAKNYDTEGYTINIKTFTPDGALLEAIDGMPFYIIPGGNRTISGQIHGVSAGHNGLLDIFLESPLTGLIRTQADIVGTGDANPDGRFSFASLPDGEYAVFADPRIRISGFSYLGNSAPEPIRLSGGDASKDLYLSPEASGGSTLTVTLNGNFSTGGLADNVDVFASSPSGFRVKTLTALGDTSNSTTDLFLSPGEWMIGIRPAKPANSLFSQPLMADWIPPTNIYYFSDGVTPGNASFDISGQAGYSISGIVTDGTGIGIAEADVWAYQPTGSHKGAFAKTSADGTFVLRVPFGGTYAIKAQKTGLPEASENAINVGGDMNGLIIRLSKPGYTISGKVLDGNGTPLAYAPVWSWQENSGRRADTRTDSTGNYILYAEPGVWHLETDAPGIGRLSYSRTITVSDASIPDINIAPSDGTDYTVITGKAGIDSDGDFASLETPLANATVRALRFDLNGTYQGQEYTAITDSDGAYALRIPAGIYQVSIWTKAYGERAINNLNGNNVLDEAGLDDDYAGNPANVNAVTADVSDADIIIAQNSLNDVSLTFAMAQTGQEGFLKIEQLKASGEPTGIRSSKRLADLSNGDTVKLTSGSYSFSLDVPGVGSFKPDAVESNPVTGFVDISTATSVNFTLPDKTAGFVTISGTVYNGAAQAGNELEGAWVWISAVNSSYRNGSKTGSDGSYVLSVPAGAAYTTSAAKPGFVSAEPSAFTPSASSTRNFSLSASTGAISGYIYRDNNSNSAYDAGEGIPNGFVRAETVGCSDNLGSTECRQVRAPVDGRGYYELDVLAGTWKVFGLADGFTVSSFSSNISSLPAASINIRLDNDPNWANQGRMKQIFPISGGLLDDTAPGGSGMKLNIPPNAFGNSNSAGSVKTQKTSNVVQTDSSNPITGTGISLTATDNSGQAIASLDDFVSLEKVIYKAEIEAAIGSGELATSTLKSAANAFWDPTLNDWISLNTIRTVYTKATALDTDWTLYADTATTAPAFDSFISKLADGAISPYDYKLVFGSETRHFTVFAVIIPFFAIPVQAEPAPAPPPATSSSGGGGSFSSYCTVVVYGTWGTCQNDGYQYRDVTSKTPSGCRLQATQEQDKKRQCLLALEDSKIPAEVPVPENTGTAKVSNLSEIDLLFLEQGAFIVRADLDEMLPVLKQSRNHKNEQAARDILNIKMAIDLKQLPLRRQYALTNFVAYGSPDTVRIGSGERAGVIGSFLSAFGRLPETSEDWSDVIKIANGRWPSQTSPTAEKKAALAFKTIYHRVPNRKEAHDNAAVTVIAYGLRPVSRNTKNEKRAVSSFKAIYKRSPASANDWDLVRAIAYSGAARDQDTDNDGLGDKHEKAIGTNPKNPDSDGDGYNDGIEVLNGYNPLAKPRIT